MPKICGTCGEFTKDDIVCDKCGKPLADTALSSAHARSGTTAQTVSIATGGGISPSQFVAPASQVKNARRTVAGIYRYRPPTSIDVPGTGYDTICPCQSHVNPNIVAEKIELFSKQPDSVPVLAVIYRADGTLGLAGDGHHTLVAALRAQITMELQLVTFGIAHGPANWRGTTYNEFTENAAAAKGTVLK